MLYIVIQYLYLLFTQRANIIPYVLDYQSISSPSFYILFQLANWHRSFSISIQLCSSSVQLGANDGVLLFICISIVFINVDFLHVSDQKKTMEQFVGVVVER